MEIGLSLSLTSNQGVGGLRSPIDNRILLSPVLAGEMTISEIVLNELDWYKEKGITLHTGKQISKIDRVKLKEQFIHAED